MSAFVTVAGIVVLLVGLVQQWLTLSQCRAFRELYAIYRDDRDFLQLDLREAFRQGADWMTQHSIDDDPRKEALRRYPPAVSIEGDGKP